MSTPPNLFDPSSWLPKPAAPASATAPAPAPTGIPDFIGKLDSLILAQENTNALLTSLIDQMAQQQFQRPATGPAEGDPQQVVSLTPLGRVPFLWYDTEAKEYYKAVIISIANSGRITIAPSTILTFTQTSLAIRPSLLSWLRLIGITACAGLVEFSMVSNGQNVFMHENSVLPVPAPQPFTFIQGVLDYPIDPPIFPPSGNTVTVAQFIFSNRDPLLTHTVMFQAGTYLMDKITPEEAKRLGRF